MTWYMIWYFPKIRGTFLGVAIIRLIVYWGLYWGPLILGNYHMYNGWPVVIVPHEVQTCHSRLSGQCAQTAPIELL